MRANTSNVFHHSPDHPAWCSVVTLSVVILCRSDGIIASSALLILRVRGLWETVTERKSIYNISITVKVTFFASPLLALRCMQGTIDGRKCMPQGHLPNIYTGWLCRNKLPYIYIYIYQRPPEIPQGPPHRHLWHKVSIPQPPPPKLPQGANSEVRGVGPGKGRGDKPEHINNGNEGNPKLYNPKIM